MDTKTTQVLIIPTDSEPRWEMWEGDTLQHLQGAVDGLVTAVGLAVGLDMWLNDEALLVSDPVLNSKATWLATRLGIGQSFFGVAVVAGVNREGDTVSVPESWRVELNEAIGL